MTRFIAVAALISVVASTPAFSQCTDADRTALEAYDKAWGDAGVRGDRALLETMYADAFMSVNPAGMVDKATTLTNTMQAAERNKANPQPVTVADRYVISCTPLTATITHRNTTPAAAGSTAASTYARSVHFLERRGNKWQVVSTTGHALNDQQQLIYMEQDWNDAAKGHDAAWIERNYAAFASDVSSRTGGIEYKSQAVASAKTDKVTYDALDLSELNARVEGDVGVVTGVNRLRGKDAQGKAFDRRVRFTDTFIKRDGKWQVWATQGTPIQ